MADDPYADFKDDSVPSNLDTVLIQLADELVEAQEKVDAKERELETAKDELKEIVEHRIPNVTDGLNGKLSLSDGRILEVKEEIRSSIAGEKRVPAIQWLDDHDFGHIVKRQLIFEFGKDSTEDVDKFNAAIKKVMDETGLKLVMKEQYSVHHATLNSWVKEQLGEGVALPKDIFGIFRQRSAKVKE